MALNIPNVPAITKRDPKLSEALQAVTSFVNTNITPVVGNRVAAPTFTNPGKPAG